MPELYAFVDQSRAGTASEIGKNASGTGTNLESDSSLRFYIPDGAIVDVFLLNTDNGEHPFHLHGHRFAVMATSDCPDAQTNFAGNYLYRDTVSVPDALDDGTIGWAWLRFVGNNPGVWMIHCHIDWHQEAGLSALFMEGPYQVQMSQIPEDQVEICEGSESDTDSDLALSVLDIALICGCGVLGIGLVVALIWIAMGPKRSGFSEQVDGKSVQ